MNRTLIFMILGCLLFHQPGYAQEPFLKHFGVEEGLSSNETYKITEDNAGYLLITTDRGLVRYDGYSFKNITPSGFPSIIYPWYNIRRTKSNITIISTGLKFGFYQSGKLEIKDCSSGENKKYWGNTIVPIMAWLGNIDSMLLIINNANHRAYEMYLLHEGQLKHIDQKEGVYFNLQDKFYYPIGSDHRPPGVLPVYIARENNRQQKILIKGHWSDVPFLAYHRFAEGELFIIGRSMVFLKKDGVMSIKALTEQAVLSFLPLDNNHFLIGLRNGGVKKYKIENGQLKETPTRYLNNLSVADIYRDQQQNIWFTTLESGLYEQLYLSPYSFNAGNQQVSFMINYKDTLIVGFRSGQLYHIYGNKTIKKSYVPLAGSRVLKSAFVTNGQLMFTTRDKRGGHTYIKSSNNGFWAYQTLPCVTDSGMYNLTEAGYLTFTDFATGRKKKLCRISSRIFSFLAKDNKLWIGLLDGLYVFEDGVLKKINLPDQIFKDRIIDIEPLSSGKIAIASLSGEAGIYDQGIWYILNKRKGLNADIFNDMHTVGDTIWLASNNGIFKTWLDKGRFRIRRFGKNYGLPTLNIQNFVVTKNNLYFTWHDNILSFNIQDIQSKHKIINKPFITSVIINGKKEINNKNGHFEYYQNNLEINFNNIDFTEASEQTYRYRIAQISPDWQVTKERKATYLQLPPGKYTFELQVANSQGQFSTVPTLYHFEIVPAFWQRKWFPLLILGIALLLASLVFRLRLNAVNKRKQLMLELAESKVEVLALQISPHFVFNILNNVQLAIMEEDKMRAAVIISKFARLMRLLLDHSRFRVVSLAAELEWLKKYLELELIRMPEKFTYDVRLQEIAQPEKIKIPAMLIQPFIENSIKHGIGHLENKIGHIQITVKKESDKTLLFTIDDNGIGRKASEILNKNKKNESSGIEITWRRMKLLHSDAKTEFHFEIQDKTDQNNLPEGTLVIFNIPYKFSDDEPQ